MLGGVEDLADIFNIDDAASVAVKHPERFLDKSSSTLTELSPDRHEELIDIQNAVSIRIEEAKEQRDVLFINAHFEVAASLRELINADVL